MVNNVQMAVRVSPKNYEKVEECVSRGYASTPTDFLRQALIEKIERCKAEA